MLVGGGAATQLALLLQKCYGYFMDFMSPGGHDPHEEIEPIVADLRERSEKLGLYLIDASVLTQDVTAAMQIGSRSLAELITDEGAEFAIVATFTIGDVAWRKRTIDPAQNEIDKQVQTMLPTEAEEIRRRLEEGGSLFEDDEDDI